jgi:hypothetical protein
MWKLAGSGAKREGGSMSTDTTPEINADAVKENAELLSELSLAERNQTPIVTLRGSIENWERIKTFLFASRASNVAALFLLNKPEGFLEDEEITYLFGFLRDWDQLFVENFLAVCEAWVPQEFQEALRTEAKIELKWAKEWMTANSDQRIHKYPGLPWRSFLRKIMAENFAFAMKFLELTAAPATDENVKKMVAHIQAFLEAKKKVVCVFPKRWNKLNEH